MLNLTKKCRNCYGTGQIEVGNEFNQSATLETDCPACQGRGQVATHQGQQIIDMLKNLGVLSNPEWRD